MGGSHHSTNVHETEIHNKDITQRNNNVENENNHYHEHNIERNNLYGDKAYGGGVASDGDSNYGNAVYKLVNLDDQSLYLQNLGLFKDLTGAIGQGAQLGGAIWQAADPKSFEQQGKGIMGGISQGAGIAGQVDDSLGLSKMAGMDDWGWMQNLDQQYELQNLMTYEDAMMSLKKQQGDGHPHTQKWYDQHHHTHEKKNQNQAQPPQEAPQADPLDEQAQQILNQYGNNGALDHQGIKKLLADQGKGSPQSPDGQGNGGKGTSEFGDVDVGAGSQKNFDSSQNTHYKTVNADHAKLNFKLLLI